MATHHTIPAARLLGQKGLDWRIYLTYYNAAKNSDKFYEIIGNGTHMVTVRHGRNGTAGRTLPQENSKRLQWALDQANAKRNKGYDYAPGALKATDQAVQDLINPPVKPKLNLVGPYARIKFLRRVKGAPIWEALDSQGQLLLHLPVDSAKQLLESLEGWSGGVDLNDREIIKLSS